MLNELIKSIFPFAFLILMIYFIGFWWTILIFALFWLVGVMQKG